MGQTRDMHKLIESVLRSPRRGRTKAKLLVEPEIRALARGELISFWANGEPGVRVTCLSGILWVTCENDLVDYLLMSGERFIPRARGKIVIHALSPARIMRGAAFET